MGRQCCGNGPGECPAITVKHRQSPKVYRISVQSDGVHVAQGAQVGASMMVDAALRVAGGARGVE